MDTPADTKLIAVHNFPLPLWRELKAKAARDNHTLQTAVVKAIEQYLGKTA